MALLELQDIHTYYDSIHALKGISVELNAGEIVTLIGANGAGKTTILNTISGLLHPRVGDIFFEGEPIHHRKAHEVVNLGISQVPEGRKIFSRLTVQENLSMGAFTRTDRAGIDDDLARVFILFPRLKERRRQLGGTLSGGEQQMLATGRALMSRPRVLLMDEPSMGLAPLLVQSIFDTILEISKQGMTVLLVEQNANMALSIANRAYVLETGTIVLSGSAEEVRHDPRVRAAYLGEG
jgi:branched-chain amino acid transport system ATP-binding protein